MEIVEPLAHPLRCQPHARSLNEVRRKALASSEGDKVVSHEHDGRMVIDNAPKNSETRPNGIHDG